MTDPSVVFLLGPFYFVVQLLKLVFLDQMEIELFIASGVGTAFWAGVATKLTGGTL
ncbi:hypothetical protein [Halorubrum sp. GN11_10-6_MGM]|uniref:hypothetical protein n=1 Tax=Halorubrum sp. GN11_10-6_MGM TaxID=2518112 RepID=UPI00130D65FB|nr:hypothetical protein [Halorubrum sp. GN11_10-6_MGM]